MRILAILALTLYLLLPDRSAAQAPTRTGKDYAVFFYVTSFKPGWQGLPTTKTEAEDLAKELQTNYGFICQTVSNPTRQQIFDTLSAWNTRIGPNDQVLFFFSSHGYYDPASKLGYLIAADGLSRDEYFRSWLDYNSLRPFFAKCKANNILVALDACHSGSFGNIERSMPDGPDYNKDADCQTRVERAFKYRSRLYVCSGNENARTPGESRFAAKFLGLLRTGAPNTNGIINFRHLNFTLGDLQNPEPVHGEFTGHEQGGDFVFIPKNACNTAPPPDRDGDKVPDAADKCPDTWGGRPDGCPTAVPTDNIALDLDAWRAAKQQNTEAAYRDYLRRFPQGEFKEPANTALRQLEEEAVRRRDNTAWEVALEKNTAEGFKKYLADYPAGLHRAEAEAKLKDPDDANMLLIRGDTFQMGSTVGDDEQPVHNVTVRDFYLGKYEVTVTEFKAFIDATGYTTDAEKKNGEGSYLWNSTDSKWELKPGINWRHDAEGKRRPLSEYNHPVIHVSWNDATEYCKWLSRQSGKTYRLPTEAEWEYAAGNGSRHTKYSWGNGDPSGKNGGNVADESKRPGDGSTWTTKFEGYNDGYWYTAPVGSYNPNDFGLHDMTGNVWEWCSDWYSADYYKNSPSSNPTGPTSGSYRVRRGGSWLSYPRYCRVAYRYGDAPGGRGNNTGFRLARTN
jgi:formylglycine-generating enzyme required for sulfatase activity